MSAPEVVVLPDPRAVAEEAARRVIAQVGDSDGPFSLALAGGSTPKAMYQLLASRHARKIDWARVGLYFGDERCVPPQDPQSNFRMVTMELLVPLAAAGHSPRAIARMAGELDPDVAAAQYAEKLDALPVAGGAPALDLVLLGMGPDGHTASLFPGSEILQADGTVAATAQPQLGVRRISLTYRTLNAARSVLVTVTGADKAPALRLAVDGPPDSVPLRGVRPASGRLTILCDAAAAAGLGQPSN